MRFPIKIVVTAAVVVLAIGLTLVKFRQYLFNPWTRDGQVRANVIQIAPRVSGPIVSLPIKDNQYVKKGDVLFTIDPRTFQAAFDKASANLDQTRDQIVNLTQQVKSVSMRCKGPLPWPASRRWGRGVVFLRRCCSNRKPDQSRVVAHT